MSELVVTRADDGGTFRRAPGELVVVRLTDIPTSGYRWQRERSGPARQGRRGRARERHGSGARRARAPGGARGGR
ncbi:MAG TPA: hypothetical protein VFI65_10485 [Streptosporangiaceae bacterium]|nr:hypothetical protein [Streptosporangiaceae bacterium]